MALCERTNVERARRTSTRKGTELIRIHGITQMHDLVRLCAVYGEYGKKRNPVSVGKVSIKSESIR
jgi:hypothetical protein